MNSIILFIIKSMTTCHASCLTCSTSLFNNCLTCGTGITLSYGTCNCDQAWQTQCTGQYDLRQVIQFLDMFVKLYIVGIMLLYILKVRLPLSYRIWNALSGLSILLYNQIFYLQYQDERALKAMFVSNGPYFSTYRVMEISTSHIFPTLSLLIIMIVLLVIMYYPFSIFIKQRESLFQYLKIEGLHMVDCALFFGSKLMFFYIGKFIKQSSTASTLYIVVLSVYAFFILINWIRIIYKYHDDSTDNFAYDSPLYLYTILSPASMVGIALSSSEIVLLIVYCSPIALLALILLLNRNMKVFTRENIKFLVVQTVMIGLIVAFIMLDNTIKTYLIVGIIFLSVLVISIQGFFLYKNGFQIETAKVYPVLENEDEKPAAKKIYAEENNDKYKKQYF